MNLVPNSVNLRSLCAFPIHPTSGMSLTPESLGRISNGICPTPTKVHRVRFKMLPGTGEQCGNDESGMLRYARPGYVHTLFYW